jgi:hypothetical protein
MVLVLTARKRREKTQCAWITGILENRPIWADQLCGFFGVKERFVFAIVVI